jgi:hypothetical protein
VIAGPAHPRLVASGSAPPRILVMSSPAHPELIASSPGQTRLLRPVVPIPVQRHASDGTVAEGLNEPGAYDNLDGAGCSHW